jgi:hypothetical protein
MPDTPRRIDDLDDEGLLRREPAFAPMRWFLANWFSLLVLVGMLLNMGGWVRLREWADTDQVRSLGTVQSQLNRHIDLDDLNFVRKDVLEPELKALRIELANLSTLLQNERNERIARGR